MRLSCALSQRKKAANIIGNVLRAARVGNCQRAEHILDSREYYSVTECTQFSTLARVHQIVRRCRQKAA